MGGGKKGRIGAEVGNGGVVGHGCCTFSSHAICAGTLPSFRALCLPLNTHTECHCASVWVAISVCVWGCVGEAIVHRHTPTHLEIL